MYTHEAWSRSFNLNICWLPPPPTVILYSLQDWAALYVLRNEVYSLRTLCLSISPLSLLCAPLLAKTYAHTYTRCTTHPVWWPTTPRTSRRSTWSSTRTERLSRRWTCLSPKSVRVWGREWGQTFRAGINSIIHTAVEWTISNSDQLFGHVSILQR